jgi:hypothetical protein
VETVISDVDYVFATCNFYTHDLYRQPYETGISLQLSSSSKCSVGFSVCDLLNQIQITVVSHSEIIR